MKKLFVLVVLVLITAGAFGDNTLNGQWLRSLWQANQRYSSQVNKVAEANYYDSQSSAEFTGFVFAVKQVFEINGSLEFPNKITIQELCTIVGKYLDDHPEEWKQPASTLVYEAFHEIYPGKQ